MIQTWLPFPNFRESAQALSDSDLELQRYHVLHIIETLHLVETSDLPEEYDKTDVSDLSLVCNMWREYEMQLCEYGLEICDEWSVRNRIPDPLYQHIAKHLEWATSDDALMGTPQWFGNIDFHDSHKSALFRKNPEHYRETLGFDPRVDKIIWPAANG